jgi:anti-anti-sigma regulatory factor
MIKISRTENENTDTVELKIEGKVVGDWAHALQQTCRQVLESGREHLVLDFSSVTSIDQEGLRLLKEVDCPRIRIVGLDLFLKDRISGMKLKQCIIDPESQRRK